MCDIALSRQINQMHVCIFLPDTICLFVDYLVAGQDPKWLLLDAEDLKLSPIPAPGPFGPGTFLKVLREEDMSAAKERASQVTTIAISQSNSHTARTHSKLVWMRRSMEKKADRKCKSVSMQVLCIFQGSDYSLQ